MATFASRFKEYTVLYRPVQAKTGATGLLEITDKGEEIEFHQGMYEIKDKDKINFLRKHAKNGLHFHEIGGPDDIITGDSEEEVGRKKAIQVKKAEKIKKQRVVLAETDESDIEEVENLRKKARVSAS